METIEIIIYFVFAVMIGALIIGFTLSIDGRQLYDKTKNMLFGSDDVKFERIDSDELAMKAYNFWKECGYGQDRMELTVYVKDELDGGGKIDREFLFKGLIKYNFCYSIQSNDSNCGYREDVYFTEDIDPPQLIKLMCDNTDEHTLNISSAE